MKEQTKQTIQYLRKNRGYILGGTALIIFLVIIGLVSDTGHRLLAAIGLADSSTIVVVSPRDDVQIYLDEKYETKVGQQDEETSIAGLPPGKHSVIITKTNHYPWTKTVTLEAEESITLRPFIIPHAPEQSRISRSDPRWSGLRQTLSTQTLPTSDRPILSDDERIAVWVEDDSIIIEWMGEGVDVPPMFCEEGGSCANTITVIPTRTPVKDLAFYKDRNDVIIFAAQEGVYALEVSKSGTQNFQPIYEGSSPRFTKNSPRTIVVQDNNQLLEIVF